MKYGILSIIIAVTGIVFVIWFNIEVAELVRYEFLRLENKTEFNPAIFTTGKMNKLIAFGLGLTGIILGFKSLRNKKQIGKIGILLSIIVLILTFTPIWTYIVSDGTFDISIG